MMISHTDILVDVAIGLFSVYTILYCVYTLFMNRKQTQKPVVILLFFLLVCSALYLVQTASEVFTGTTAVGRVWDAYNLIQGVANLVAAQLVTRFVCQNVKDDHKDIINKLPLA